MVAYFDSSVLLTILLNEERYHEAVYLWNDADFRLSSFLLRIETTVSLRRIHKAHIRKDDDLWMPQKINDLYKMLDKINYKPIDDTIEQTIIRNNDLANCKSLDAIHLATALYIKKNIREQKLVVCTFDNNMISTAKLLGFNVNAMGN